MVGFLKLLLILGLVSFFSYTFYVEPNASDDPAGAISRSAQRLATICERNQEECEFLGDVGQGIGQAANVGWKLATGQGRLVYVPNDGNSYAAGTVGYGAGATDRSENSSRNFGRLTTLFRGDGSSNDDAGGSSQTYRSSHRPVRSEVTSDDRSYGRSDGRSLGDLIRSTNLFGDGGGGARNAGYRDDARTYTSGNGQHDNQHCN